MSSNAQNFHILDNQEIADLKNIEQSSKWLKNKLFHVEHFKADVNKFKQDYYGIWLDREPIEIDIKEKTEEFLNKKTCLGENYKIWPKSYDMVNNIDYNSKILNLNAIVTNNSDLRILPTIHPCFQDPKIGGEGYPFDYIQEAMAYIGLPIKLLAYSKNKEWALVKTNFVEFRWIKTKDIALITDQQITNYLNNDLGVVTKDNATILDDKQQHLENLKLGTILPITKNGEIIISYKNNNQLDFMHINAKDNFIQKPLEFNIDNISHILDELIDKPYGWGNLNGNRDCSALTKDFFAAFGHFLLRNSSQQAESGGEIQNIESMSSHEKFDYITTNAKPFATLLYQPGHIVIYAGHDKNNLYLFHAAWGIKTIYNDVEGRNILGKSAITTHNPGKELTYANKDKNDLLAQTTVVIFIDKLYK
jgi:cell wall-associated NlpC family hydrolase